MRKLTLFASLCILATSLVAAAPAHAQQVRADIRLNTGGHDYVYFDNQPDVVLVPGTRVYYMMNGSDEVYRYRNTWFIYRGGDWYRASNYRGPYRYVREDHVPYAIMNVPTDWRDQYRTQYRHDNGRHRGWNKDRNDDNRDDNHHRD